MIIFFSFSCSLFSKNSIKSKKKKIHHNLEPRNFWKAFSDMGNLCLNPTSLK